MVKQFSDFSHALKINGWYFYFFKFSTFLYIFAFYLDPANEIHCENTISNE
jgi:hypothetical protein